MLQQRNTQRLEQSTNLVMSKQPTRQVSSRDEITSDMH